MLNLRPDFDFETEYVSLDRPRVLRVLARIIADLDELDDFPPIADEEQGKVEDAEARRSPPPPTDGGARPSAETVEHA